ncbi:MAG: BTAD domain-containing putative transcriptional regulator [Actinomycetota bacterium]
MSLSRVLRTRLLPPRLPAACLPREGLVARVVEGLAGRLVVLSAGAGFGKSTLMAQAVGRLPDRRRVWLSLDERAADPASLVAHLAAGIAAQLPGFGAGHTPLGPPQEMVRQLTRELVTTMPDDLVVAIDDAHLLRDPAAVETLDLLLHDLPPQVHLLVATRARLPVPVGRLAARGLMEVGEDDLALTREESDALLALTGTPLPDADAAALHELTAGWITGLLLAARSGASLVRMGRDAGSSGRLFEYLAEELLRSQPEDVQDFLVQTAALERFTPRIAASVTGRADAREVLDAVLGDPLFAVGVDAEEGEWFRYRHMFQTLLRRRLEERDRGWQGALHRRAAAAWLSAGEPGEAVRHFLAAGELSAVVDALEPVAERMMMGAEGATLTRWLRAIPPELWSDSPGLVLAQATALFARAEFPQALDALERAMEELVDAGDHERAANSFFRYLRALALAGGKQERAIAAAERYLPRIDPAARSLPPARLVLAQCYAEAVRYDDAERELRAATDTAPDGEAPVVAAYAEAIRAWAIDHPRGRSDEALATLDRVVGLLERWEDADRLYFLPFVRAHRAVMLNDVGRFEEALAETERLREACDSRGIGQFVVSVVAWLRFEALAGLGRWSELGAELAAQAPLFARIGNVARGYRFHVATARLAAENRDAATVASRVDSARAGLRATGNAFDEAMALGDLAFAAWEVGLVDEARGLAGEAHALAVAAQAPWPQAKAALAGALAHGAGEEGDALLAEALELTARHSLLGLWTRGGRRVAPRLLARAITRALGPTGMAARLAVAAGAEVLDEAAELLVEAEPAARARLVEAAAGAPGAEAAVEKLTAAVAPRRPRTPRRDAPVPGVRVPLRVVTLGGFALWRDGVRVPEGEFERQKARALLALLVCARGPVHRDALVEALWPDLPPERGLGALNSTLYSLRRVLEPGLPRGASSSVVVADQSAYRLDLSGVDDDWDAQRFLELAAAAVAAAPADIDALLAAEALYVGPFLPEWAYEEWTVELRTEVEEAFAAVLARLAEALAAAGRPGAAISRYRRLLAMEPEREGWHRALMRVFAQAGERALALRQYHACRALLKGRLGVEPSKETRALYAELLREDEGADAEG